MNREGDRIFGRFTEPDGSRSEVELRLVGDEVFITERFGATRTTSVHDFTVVGVSSPEFRIDVRGEVTVFEAETPADFIFSFAPAVRAARAGARDETTTAEDSSAEPLADTPAAPDAPVDPDETHTPEPHADDEVRSVLRPERSTLLPFVDAHTLAAAVPNPIVALRSESDETEPTEVDGPPLAMPMEFGKIGDIPRIRPVRGVSDSGSTGGIGSIAPPGEDPGGPTFEIGSAAFDLDVLRSLRQTALIGAAREQQPSLFRRLRRKKGSRPES